MSETTRALGGQSREASLVPIAASYQQLTVNNALAQGFATPSASASYVMVGVSGGTARFRDDGVAPTAALGFLIQPNQPFFYKGDIAAFRIIATAAAVEVDGLFYE